MSDTTNTETVSTAVTTVPKAPVAMTARGVALATLEDVWRFGGIILKSGLAPKGLQSQEAIVVAVQMGLEVGLTPMAALQNIAVINGRPSIWGDAQLAICRGTGELEAFEEWYEVSGARIPRNPTAYQDGVAAVCKVKRRGYPPAETSFSVADAKAAGLWSKDGPWKQYPARMLKFRARSFALRDQFGDALKGLRTPEENMEIGAIDVETVQDAPKAEKVSLVGDAPKDPPTVIVVPEQPVVAEKPADLTHSAQLEQMVSGWGHNFTTLQKWMVAEKFFAGADSCGGYEDLPVDVTKRLLRAHVGLKAGLAAVGGAK